jgi:hypothetical protein
LDFKGERVNVHNEWPKRVEFKAETQFKARLELNDHAAPFKTVILDSSNDVAYQICVGHLVDGLEALPFRPDYMFDHCFRIIDERGKLLFPKKGIKGVVEGLGTKLLRASFTDWSDTIDILGKNIPLMTCRYIAKRICVAKIGIDDQSKQVAKRAEHGLGSTFYSEFVDKFGRNDQGNISSNMLDVNFNQAASFLKLYMSGAKGTKKGLSTQSSLDLTKIANVPTNNQRIEVILSLLLFTMRNERAHGGILSPFITSKATLKRYESYYFAMLASYIFSLGVMQLYGFGGLDGAKIKDCCNANTTLQKSFFQ